MDELNALRVIHVSGTKGKGSTCAFAESLLRHLGYRTGFYRCLLPSLSEFSSLLSSPHLVHVRERIRINGEPLSETQFAKYFFEVYKRLQRNAVSDSHECPSSIQRMSRYEQLSWHRDKVFHMS
jgi:folylpolyglutamate synthase